jgi:hypothetical protein
MVDAIAEVWRFQDCGVLVIDGKGKSSQPLHLSLPRSLLLQLGPRPFRLHLGSPPSISEKESEDAIAVVTLSMTFISLEFVVMSSRYLADFNPIAFGPCWNPRDEFEVEMGPQVLHNSFPACECITKL